MSETSVSARIAPLHFGMRAEPIQIPGSIQPHGYLFVLDDTDFRIVSVSQNAADILSLPTRAIIGHPIDEFLVSETTIGLTATFETGEPVIRVRFQQSLVAGECTGLIHRSAGLVLLEIAPQIPAEHAEAVLGQVHLAIERIDSSEFTASAC